MSVITLINMYLLIYEKIYIDKLMKKDNYRITIDKVLVIYIIRWYFFLKKFNLINIKENKKLLLIIFTILNSFWYNILYKKNLNNKTLSNILNKKNNNNNSYDKIYKYLIKYVYKNDMYFNNNLFNSLNKILHKKKK